MNHAHFIARRKRLLKTIGDGVAIIPTAPEVVRNRDAHHPFRFDSYFWYLSGFPEPEAVVVLVGGRRPKSILFCREKHEEREIWDGYRYGPKAAKAAFGFDAAYPIELLDQKLPEFLVDRDTLWHAVGHDDTWDARIARALNAVRAESRAGKRAPRAIHDLRFELDAMRLIKDAAEAEIQQRSADIASAGHARAMHACRPGMAEYELEAELTYEFRKRGADAHAYTPIVAGGANACVLHYVENNKILNDNTLVLIDAGCEVAGYAADITRTFPVNGRFNAAQKDVYEIVLAAQHAAIKATAPGRHFMEGHDAALRVLTQGLIDLKLLSGDLDNLIEKGDYKRFYMHRTGHWLGLDVHDAGEYKVGDAWTTLQPGMTLTVEPGLYIRPGADIPPALAGIGIRIEDDVRVTEAGCHVFTTAPKTVAEIEEVMRHD
ncbi:aminopeptidase P N-terminal domain-containing protein [Quatrionicoccus australiensis]|uniref:aminopeptidase P N-terminal domain-containing protein n=1 Tax=Quatrionicoccus australiensis TaxID=138118 RepID=UPI001CF89AD5|nr:aminopeptidase P N-terminal domain-containing protein [Quatrionicoccus australiensis]UCV15700.1 aminopeptidase P N-terminal domain-containing protein [Quatrionicoccus australiensis]